VGDGDLGITASKMAAALREYVDQASSEDIGSYFIQAGMAVNRSAPSTLGTLTSTALLACGKSVKGRNALEEHDLAAMLSAANQAIQDRGKAKPGDKTIVDVLDPAAQAFQSAIERGTALGEAADLMLHAAAVGLESATSLRSRVGRASWVGERTEGKIDPGCALAITVLRSLAEAGTSKSGER